jgi:hypothetical protein
VGGQFMAPAWGEEVMIRAARALEMGLSGEGT